MARKKEKINDPVLDLARQLNQSLTGGFKEYYNKHLKEGGCQDEQSSKRDI